MEKNEIFAYFVEREDEHGRSLKILLDSWDTVCHCLSSLNGTDSFIAIHRMPICTKE